ncbi:hypothetical protein BDW02DRAFT_132797 [Decorospora gaudefroyi]|uniref:Uncharacterized protein n=1 Tax=Decorospora gaudefroyi TaxID=184978 RepID=A0A6A5JZ88_9PLEO|nr:hypothetical protein BDW02DRAFT_132797 [Decorospora gaudefroyi]
MYRYMSSLPPRRLQKDPTLVKMSNSKIPPHILNALIGCLCIAILGLAVTLEEDMEAFLPSNMKGTGMMFLFWPGCGVVVDMLLFGFLWWVAPWEQGPIGKRLAYLNGLVFVACFIVGRPLIVLIYTHVAWGQAVKNVTNTTSGCATVESWACACSKRGYAGSTGSLCTELRVVRDLLIPVLVLGAMMLPSVILRRLSVAKEENTIGKRSDADA